MFSLHAVLCLAVTLPFGSEEQRMRCERVERIDCYYEEAYDKSGGSSVATLKEILTAWAHDAQKPEEPCVLALSGHEIEAFVAGLDLVKPGDGIDAVRGILGPPTYLLPRSRKDGDFTRGTRMKYYLVKQNVECVNDLVDVHVSFLFDRLGRLESTRVSERVRLWSSRKMKTSPIRAKGAQREGTHADKYVRQFL